MKHPTKRTASQEKRIDGGAPRPALALYAVGRSGYGDGNVMSVLDRFSLYAFDRAAKENGIPTWTEPVLMEALGYKDKQSFKKVRIKAMEACLALNIEPHSDFIFENGAYRFTLFACYLIAMRSDPKKPLVAEVQFKLAALAASVADPRLHAALVQRVEIREKLASGNKTLHATALRHGVEDFSRFVDAGYRGMYNMSLRRLSEVKGVEPGESLLDRMDVEELAANLFRVTQTDKKIRIDNVEGQAALEDTAVKVGKAVRRTMMSLNKTKPEDLPITEHITQTKKRIKGARTELKKLATSKARNAMLGTFVEEHELMDERERGFTKDPDEDEREPDSE
jgi:DNA-damage-inducible protein D